MSEDVNSISAAIRVAINNEDLPALQAILDDDLLSRAPRKGGQSTSTMLERSDVLNLALCLSSAKGYLPIVTLTLSLGANIHSRSDFALRCAAQNNHPKVVDYLLMKGADLFADNNAAIGAAYEKSQLPLMRVLIKHGAKLEDVGSINKFHSRDTITPAIVRFYASLGEDMTANHHGEPDMHDQLGNAATKNNSHLTRAILNAYSPQQCQSLIEGCSDSVIDLFLPLAKLRLRRAFSAPRSEQQVCSGVTL